jgi:hypothetical protein
MIYKSLKPISKSKFILITSFALWFLSPIAVFPESNTGRLTGTVFDAKGAAISGAQVIASDNRTSNKRTTESDSTGAFAVPLLDVGSYTVTVSKHGFATFRAGNVNIEVGRDYALRAVLDVGRIDTVVNVNAARANVATADSSVTVNANQILDLPLNGRNPLSLVLLQAGSSVSISGTTQTTYINGQRASFAAITRDGINIQDAFSRTNAADFASGRPSVDDTEEFTISSQNAGADQGYGSAQIRMVTPRGASSTHGSLWEFNRNSLYSANDFFNNKANVKKPFRNRNQAGGKIGGSVPGSGNKLFYFAFYEALRDVVTSPATRTLLLPDARRGTFTYVDNAGATRKIDLFSLVPSVSGIDSIVDARLLAKMPTAGNRNDIGDALNTQGISFNQPSNTNRDTFTTRIDYTLSEHHNLNVVFSRNKETNQRPDQNNSEGFYIRHPIIQSSANKELVAADRWTGSSGFSSEIRGGIFFSDVPFKRTTAVPENFLVPFPIGTTTSAQYISNPEVTFLDQGRKIRTYNLQNNSEMPAGKIRIRFGAEMQMFQVDPYNYFGTVPAFYAGTNPNTPSLISGMFPGGISTAQLTSANSLFAFLGGIISSGTQSFNLKDKNSGFSALPKKEDYRHSDYSFYIDQEWRATRQLTLNIGLRYEILTPLRLLNGLALEPGIPHGTDPIAAILNPNGSYNFVGGNAGGGNRLYKTDRNNFAPVLSFAYNPRIDNPLMKAIFGRGPDQSVIRGGFRISYANDSILTAARNALSSNSGLNPTTVNAVDPHTGSAQLNVRPETLPPIQPPAVMVPRTYAQNNGPANGNFGVVFGIDPNIRTTRINEYYLSFQRSAGWGTVFEIRYMGSRSDNLWRSADYNQIDIRTNGFAEDFNRARRNLLANGNPAVGETLTVFPLLAGGGNLANSTVRTNLRNGTPADLAYVYVTGQQAGSVKFLPNPSTGVADLLRNSAKYRYNSLQVEVRKQFASDFSLQANYTWQKTLTDAIGTSQALTDTYLDIENPRLEYTRADYDTPHVFNLNFIWSLPFGKQKLFANHLSTWADRVIGGWQLSGFMRIMSGPPITIVDPRGTLNRAARSTRQTPDASVTAEKLQSLTGRFENAKGIYFINPSIVNPATGRAAEGYGTTPFAGQVLFNAAPGTTGSLGRAILNGPGYFNFNASLMKNIGIRDNVSLQLRLDAFNAFNHTNFYLANQLQSINSTSFGKLQNDWSPREVQIAARLSF